MSSPIIQQPWLAPYLDPQAVTKRGRGEMRDELLIDDLKLLPWKNEDDPYSARPPPPPRQSTAIFSSNGQLEANDLSFTQDAVMPHKMETSAHQSLYSISPYQRYPEQPLMAQQPSHEPPNGKQQQPNHSSKGSRARQRRAAEKKELEHLRSVVYGNANLTVTAAATNPLSEPNQSMSREEKQVMKRLRGQAKQAQRQQAAAEIRARTRLGLEPASGANTADVVGNRMQLRLTGLSTKPKDPRREEGEESAAGVTLVKMEDRSPSSGTTLDDRSGIQRPEHGRDSLAYTDTASMRFAPGSEGTAIGMPDLRERSMIAISSMPQKSSPSESAERYSFDLWNEDMNQEIMAEKARFNKVDTHGYPVARLNSDHRQSSTLVGELPSASFHPLVSYDNPYDLPRAIIPESPQEIDFGEDKVVLPPLRSHEWYHPIGSAEGCAFSPKGHRPYPGSLYGGGLQTSPYYTESSAYAGAPSIGDYGQGFSYYSYDAATKHDPYSSAGAPTGSYPPIGYGIPPKSGSATGGY